MTALFHLLEKYANKKNIFIGVVIIILFNVVFLPMFPKLFTNQEIPLESILDLKFSYSSETSYQIFSNLGNEGRKIYRLSEIIVDTPYAVIYGFIYALIIFILLKNNKLNGFIYLSIVPFLISFFDVLENTGVIIMISNYPKKLETINNLASLFTSLKWIFAGITFLIIIGLLFIQFFKNKKTAF